MKLTVKAAPPYIMLLLRTLTGGMKKGGSICLLWQKDLLQKWPFKKCVEHYLDLMR